MFLLQTQMANFPETTLVIYISQNFTLFIYRVSWYFLFIVHLIQDGNIVDKWLLGQLSS